MNLLTKQGLINDMLKLINSFRAKNIIPLIFIVLVAFLTNVSAMDFSWESSGDVKLMLKMEGDIQRGDFEKFRAFMQQNYNAYINGTRMVILSSNGGDIVETLRIATILRAMYAEVLVSKGKCASSCFFLYISGIKRPIMGDVGIHRPYFDRSYFAGLPLEDAKKKQSELARAVNAFLEENSVPRALIEVMNRTSSTEIYWLSPGEVDSLGLRPAWYEEFLIAKCGYDKSLESKANDDESLMMTFLENDTKVRNCEQSFLQEEFRKLRALLENWTRYGLDGNNSLELPWPAVLQPASNAVADNKSVADPKPSRVYRLTAGNNQIIVVIGQEKGNKGLTSTARNQAEETMLSLKRLAPDAKLDVTVVSKSKARLSGEIRSLDVNGCYLSPSGAQDDKSLAVLIITDKRDRDWVKRIMNSVIVNGIGSDCK